MAELTNHDIIQIYQDVLCLYKGAPVKVVEVNNVNRMHLFNLLTQRLQWVDFVFENFGPPLGRIGYVNINNHALYVCRKPVRRFSNGLNKANTVIKQNDGERSEQLRYAMELALERTHSSFVSTMFNVYPTFKEAFELAVENKGSVAFDKSFAVNASGMIFYRASLVGTIPFGSEDPYKTEFLVGYEYLSNMLRGGYEKIVRTFAAS